MLAAKHSLSTSLCRLVIKYWDVERHTETGSDLGHCVFHEELAQPSLPHALFSPPPSLIRGLDSRSPSTRFDVFHFSSAYQMNSIFACLFLLLFLQLGPAISFCSLSPHTHTHTHTHEYRLLPKNFSPVRVFRLSNQDTIKPIRIESIFCSSISFGNKGLVMELSHDQDRSSVRWN